MKFIVQMQASYRLSDPVLPRLLKMGRPVALEGIVLSLDLSEEKLTLGGCLFGTEAERKEAGSGPIEDPAQAQNMARFLFRQVVFQPGTKGKIGNVFTNGEEGARNRISLEDLVRNCPNTAEATQAKKLLENWR